MTCTANSYPGLARLLLPLLAAVSLFLALPAFTGNRFQLSETTIDQAVIKYGPDARKRLTAWVDLLDSNTPHTELEKLEQVNSFVNRLPFVDDNSHWQRKDYWSTPIEFLASNGGDCEDFTIAKYISLRLLGIADEKMSLTYVKSITLNQAHMVLTYYQSPGAVPLVLDNLTNAILPADQRKDLLPIYSFNGTGLWLAKQRGKGKQVGGSDRLGKWRQLLQRMPEELN